MSVAPPVFAGNGLLPIHTRYNYTTMRSFLYAVLLLGLVLPFASCDPTLTPTPPKLDRCNYQLPQLTFSDPGQCAPQLLTFADLNQQMIAVPGSEAPPIKDVCSTEGNYRDAVLPGISGTSFRLHIYKAAPVKLTVSVYGEVDCDRTEQLLCTPVTAVATRLEVDTRPQDPSVAYRRFFVRFSYGAPDGGKFARQHRVELAAYETREPAPAGQIRYRTKGGDVAPGGGNYQIDNESLAFSCSGRSFQRLVIGGCDLTRPEIETWIQELGLDVSEQYYGPFGNVVVLTLPPGLDPDTAGGSARDLRAKANGGGDLARSNAEADHLINLFNPQQPNLGYGSILTLPDVKQLRKEDVNASYLANLLPPFRLQERPADPDNALLVSIIDSGVDDVGENGEVVRSTLYRGRTNTEYVFPDQFGYDFISKDFLPNDRTPHGTHVAATLVSHYRHPRPLSTIHFKIFGEEGIASYFGALVSLYEATAVGSHLVNMSWGIELPLAPPLLDCAVATAAGQGISLITSAGNDSADITRDPQWPAAFAPRYSEQMITVGSYWYNGRGYALDPNNVALLDFSNFGDPAVTLAGYMTSPVPAYRADTILYPLGTSFSAPAVAGALAERLADSPRNGLSLLQRDYGRADSLRTQTLLQQYLPLQGGGSNRP